MNEKKIEHIPVLRDEVLYFLKKANVKKFVDATVGLGGHSKSILESGDFDDIEIIAIDKDERNLNEAKKNLSKYKNKIKFFCDSFANIENFEIDGIDAILFDLGLSSYHLDSSCRGFSFHGDEVLDMRYNTNKGKSAKQILNEKSEKELNDIFSRFDVQNCNKLIGNIIRFRDKKKIEKNSDFVKIIFDAYESKNSKTFAKIFQALRIYTNNEIEEIEKALKKVFKIMNKGAIIINIAYHSIEDRLVKRFFDEKKNLKEGKILTKNLVEATLKEVIKNPRSRSAKMRVLKKII